MGSGGPQGGQIASLATHVLLAVLVATMRRLLLAVLCDAASAKRSHGSCQSPSIRAKFAGRAQLLFAEQTGPRLVSLTAADGSMRNVSTAPAVVDVHVPLAQALLPNAVSASSLSQSTADVTRMLARLFPISARRRSPVDQLAVSFLWGERYVFTTMRLPPAYGHLWFAMLAFWSDLIRPLLSSVRAGAQTSEWPTIVLPAGSHLGAGGVHAFEEFELLWATNVTGLRIERRPWVPMCLEPSGWWPCCLRGPLPSVLGLRSESDTSSSSLGSSTAVRYALLGNFPSHAVDPRHWPAFRLDAWFALGVLPSETATAHVLWIVAAAGSNGRRISNEGGLAARIQRLVKQERPTWTFSQLRGDGRKLDYRSELRQWARAGIVISLFGSALHNCRFMANRTTLVEIHGALQSNDRFGRADYLYEETCMDWAGVRWLPYAETGFRLNRSHTPTEAARARSFSTAHLDHARFERFIARMLRGDEDDVLREEYAAQLATHF